MRNPVVTIQVKDYGRIDVELYPDVAPNTVANFITLVQNHYYDGLQFHRVIKDFMIQGGCPNGDGTGGPGYTIKGEFNENDFCNHLQHTEGTISMARTDEQDSAGSQFFIVHKATPRLNGRYASFGRVIFGYEIIDSIVCVATNALDRPVRPVVIQSMCIEFNHYKLREVERISGRVHVES